MFRRSITYRRARWFSATRGLSSGDNLDTSIQDFFESRRTVKERSLDSAGTLLFLNRLEHGRRTPLRPSLLGELVSVTPDRAAEVASMSLFDSPTIDIEAMDPSPGQTFVDGRLFFLCSENHVIVAGDRIRESSLVRYLNNALRPDIIPPDSAVQLKRIANTSKVRAVRSHEVKSITIDAMLYNEELELIDFEEGGILATIREKLLSIVRQDLRGPESLQKSNLQALLTIKFRGRSSMFERKSLGDMAEYVLDSDFGDYTMELGNGDTIKADELVHTKMVTIPSRGKQIDHNVLWNKMELYLGELDESGALER